MERAENKWCVIPMVEELKVRKFALFLIVSTYFESNLVVSTYFAFEVSPRKYSLMSKLEISLSKLVPIFCTVPMEHGTGYTELDNNETYWISHQYIFWKYNKWRSKKNLNSIIPCKRCISPRGYEAERERSAYTTSLLVVCC